jgi:DNA-binding IclR family transcriptional regulator
VSQKLKAVTHAEGQVAEAQVTRAGRIAVLDKALSVLEALDEFAAPVPLRDITELTGIPKATIFRILQTLHDRGYVGQDSPSGNYRLTMRLAQLGRETRFDGLLVRARQHLDKLHSRFDETVNLGVLEGDRVYYLCSLETSQPLKWILRPGSSDAFHSTALGRAIVSQLSEGERERLLALGPFEARTAGTATSAAELRPILTRARKDGWALDDEHNDYGVACLAVPLLDEDRPIAAISVAVPRTRLTDELRDSIVDALLATGRAWRDEASGGGGEAQGRHKNPSPLTT